jgi:hypothetical protein
VERVLLLFEKIQKHFYYRKQLKCIKTKTKEKNRCKHTLSMEKVFFQIALCFQTKQSKHFDDFLKGADAKHVDKMCNGRAFHQSLKLHHLSNNVLSIFDSKRPLAYLLKVTCPGKDLNFHKAMLY